MEKKIENQILEIWEHYIQSDKKIIGTSYKKAVTNWDAEHAFWKFSGNAKAPKVNDSTAEVCEIPITISSSFDLSEYLIPKVAKLVELGNETEKSSSAKAMNLRN